VLQQYDNPAPRMWGGVRVRDLGTPPAGQGLNRPGVPGARPLAPNRRTCPASERRRPSPPCWAHRGALAQVAVAYCVTRVRDDRDDAW